MTDTALLQLLGRRPRLLALGEPTHGEDALLELRNELFQELVEREGYGTVALESDCLLGLVVDAYVTTGEGDLDDVMAGGFSHGFGRSAANRDLVRWMREHNTGTAAPVRFAGFDGPVETAAAASPRAVLAALCAHLGADGGELDELVGDDARWTDPAAMMDPSRSVGRTPEADRLRLLADDLATLVEARAPEDADLARGRLYARTATGLLRYHAALADPSPDRLAVLCAQRDVMMADNLRALAAHGPTLVHAHNAHLQRARSSMRMGEYAFGWWGAGAIVAADLGDEYGFVAGALGTIRHHGVGEPPPDTIEGMLYARGGARLVAGPPAASRRRESEWFGYAPLDPDHLPGYEAVAFVRDCSAGSGVNS